MKVNDKYFSEGFSPAEIDKVSCVNGSFVCGLRQAAGFKNNLCSSCSAPTTVLKAIENLEEFLLADLGQQWDAKFIRTHFEICKKQVEEIQRKETVRHPRSISEVKDFKIDCSMYKGANLR